MVFGYRQGKEKDLFCADCLSYRHYFHGAVRLEFAFHPDWLNMKSIPVQCSSLSKADTLFLSLQEVFWNYFLWCFTHFNNFVDFSVWKGKEILANLGQLWDLSLYPLPIETLLWRISGMDYEHSKTEVLVGQATVQTGIYVSNSGKKKPDISL